MDVFGQLLSRLCPTLDETRAGLAAGLAAAWAEQAAAGADVDGRAHLAEIAATLAVPLPVHGLFGLYPVIDAGDESVLPGLFAQAGRVGAALCQLRSKGLDDRTTLARARLAREMCTTRLVINDRADIARTVSADGVHVGRTDLPAAAVRDLVGPDRVVGASSHQKAQFDDEVGAARLDYCALGPVFLSPTKQGHAEVVGLHTLRQVAADSPVPVCAIGGITDEDRVADVVAAGADLVAVVSAYRPGPAGARAAVAMQLAACAGLCRRGDAR